MVQVSKHLSTVVSTLKGQPLQSWVTLNCGILCSGFNGFSSLKFRWVLQFCIQMAKHIIIFVWCYYSILKYNSFNGWMLMWKFYNGVFLFALGHKNQFKYHLLKLTYFDTYNPLFYRNHCLTLGEHKGPKVLKLKYEHAYYKGIISETSPEVLWNIT